MRCSPFRQWTLTGSNSCGWQSVTALNCTEPHDPRVLPDPLPPYFSRDPVPSSKLPNRIVNADAVQAGFANGGDEQSSAVVCMGSRIIGSHAEPRLKNLGKALQSRGIIFEQGKEDSLRAGVRISWEFSPGHPRSPEEASTEALLAQR